jgi:type I restriction enzyme S subunit
MTVEEVTERLIDYRGKTPPKTEAGVRLITAKVIKRGQILSEPAEYIAADFYDEWMRRGLPQDLDVLITTEAPLGEVALLRMREPIALAQRVILLRANRATIDPVYLFYALQCDFTRAELHARASGTTVSGIKQSELRQVRVPVPPLPVQRRIAGILSAYDNLIENCEQRIRMLDEMVRALYREWFVLFRYPSHERAPLVESSLGRIPKGWRVERAGGVLRETRRNVHKGALEDGQTRYVGLEHIPRRSLALNAWDEIRELGSNKLRFEPGEVLFGKIRPYFHKVSVAPFHGVCSADTFVISAIDPSLRAFATCLVSSDEFVAHASATANGAKMPRANWEVLTNFPVALPPPALLGLFSSLVEPWIACQQSLVFRIHNLRKTRDLLLARLLSGHAPIPQAAGGERDTKARTACSPR